MGVGAQHCPLGLHALWGLRAAGVVGGRPRGGWPATVVSSVCCQALSLPRPPVLWSGQPGFRDPCVPGAVGAGVGTQHRPHSVRPCGPALLVGGGGGRASPGGVPLTIVRGVWCQALSLPRPPILWSRQPGFRDPCVTGAVGGGVGTKHRPHSVRPCVPALLAVGVAEGRPRGGVPSTIVRGVSGQALSLHRLPAHWGGLLGSATHVLWARVCVGVGAQHCPLGLHALWWLRAAGVVGGRSGGGGLPPL